LTQQWSQSDGGSNTGNETYYIHVNGARFFASLFRRSNNNQVTVVLQVCEIGDQETGAKHFSLMSHRFYNMIGFGRAAEIQEGNENVV
jgi:hypothetical protein